MEYTGETLLCLASSAQLKFLRFVHAFACINAFFFFIAVEKESMIWIHHDLFLHLSFDEHLNYFQLSSILNKSC